MLSIDDSWIRPRPTREQARNDVVLGVLLALASVLFIELQRSAGFTPDLGWRGWEAYAWGAGLGLILCVRRVLPLTVLVASSLMFFGVGQRLPLIGASVFVQICVFIALYNAWAWSRQRRRLLAVTALDLTGMFAWVFWLLVNDGDVAGPEKPGLLEPAFAVAVYTIGINIIYFAGAVAWGLAAWRSARQREELRVQAERLRREQSINARRAVADERVRIARDLHDVVAHHVSGIGIQAAGARRLLDRDPVSSREALRTIERSSREAVTEMHQLVGLLRASEPGVDGADRAPQPGLAEIPALAEAMCTDRLTVTFREVGDPAAVPDTVGLSLYRTVQEALANVRRHSGATVADVVLRHVQVDGSRAAEVEVIDNGRGADQNPPGADGDGHERGEDDDGGWGLTGIRERAALHSGSVEIGDRAPGGFRVRVRIPIEESA